jgi:hypothetical protein
LPHQDEELHATPALQLLFISLHDQLVPFSTEKTYLILLLLSSF